MKKSVEPLPTSWQFSIFRIHCHEELQLRTQSSKLEFFCNYIFNLIFYLKLGNIWKSKAKIFIWKRLDNEDNVKKIFKKQKIFDLNFWILVERC